MADYSDRIKELEEEIKNTQYNKRTQHHVGLVKAKIAVLKEKEVARSSSGGKGQGYSVRKTGDATVILIGFPSAGKSTLLNGITNANSPVGAYEFTTLDVIPGVLEYKDAKIQVLDVPGILKGAAIGKGRGKEVLAVIQSADLVIFVADVLRPNALPVLQKEVYDAHIRLNQRKPDVKIKKTSRGGIRIGKTVKLTHLTDETIKSILQEFRLNNADVVIRTDITPDQLIDIIEGNKKYIPGITLLNKMDMVPEEQLQKLKNEMHPDLFISAEKKINLDALKDLIFNRLGFIRIYCKEIRNKADLDVPLIMQKGSTLRDMCSKLHKDFISKFHFARIWGKSVKFDGQKVLKLEHQILDKDIVELHLK